MKFDDSLPLMERIKKRRRHKRIRFFSIVAAILLLTYAGLSSKIIAGNNKNLNNKEVPVQAVQQSPDEKAGENDKNNKQIDTEANKESEVNQAAGKNNVEVNENSNSRANALKLDLENYIKKFKGQYGIYYINVADGNEFGINNQAVFTAASTVKIPISLYLYEKIRDGSIEPDETLVYSKKDYEEGTGEIRWNSEFGESYKIKELARLMIESSDNVAANMLLRYLGMQNIKKYMRELGGYIVKDDENVSCPFDMALYMKTAYEFYINNGKLGEEFIKFFKNTQFNDRIPRLLPEEVPIAHKTGDQSSVVCDVGIVFAKKPYILSVMSENVDEDEAADVIARISKKVYDFVAGEN